VELALAGTVIPLPSLPVKISYFLPAVIATGSAFTVLGTVDHS